MAGPPIPGPSAGGDGSPPVKAFDDGGMAYPDGSGVPAGIPDTAFSHPSWGDYLDQSRPASPNVDRDALQKPDLGERQMDPRGEFSNTPWNRRKQPDRSA